MDGLAALVTSAATRRSHPGNQMEKSLCSGQVMLSSFALDPSQEQVPWCFVHSRSPHTRKTPLSKEAFLTASTITFVPPPPLPGSALTEATPQCVCPAGELLNGRV